MFYLSLQWVVAIAYSLMWIMGLALSLMRGSLSSRILYDSLCLFTVDGLICCVSGMFLRAFVLKDFTKDPFREARAEVFCSVSMGNLQDVPSFCHL